MAGPPCFALGRAGVRRRPGGTGFAALVLVLVAAVALCAACGSKHESARSSYAYRLDFETGSEQPGNLQCQNHSDTDIDVFGTFTTVTSPVGQGRYAGRFAIPPNTSVKQRCQIIGQPTPLTVGRDDYFTLMLYVPPAWANDYPTGNPPWGPQLMEPDYQGKISGQPTVGLTLARDGVYVTLCSGEASPTMGCGSHSTPASPDTSNAPLMWAVPRGRLDAGWHELILHIHVAAGAAGAVEVWHRMKGESGWTKPVAVRGVPTVQSVDGAYGGNTIDVLQAYRGPSPEPFTVTLDDFTRSSSFDAAAAALP